MKKLFMLLLFLLLMTGCACFSGGEIHKVDSLPSLTEGAKKPSVSYVFTYDADPWIARLFSPYRIRSTCKDEFEKVLKDSAYFTVVEPGTDGDVTIDAKLYMSTSNTWMGHVADALYALTLAAIPNWKTNTVTGTAKVKGRDGKEHDYRLEDSFTVVAWLPLIAFSCSCSDWEIGVPGSVRRNIWKNLLLSMQQDGLFQNVTDKLIGN